MICSSANATHRMINNIVASAKEKLNENISRPINNGQDPVPGGLPGGTIAVDRGDGHEHLRFRYYFSCILAKKEYIDTFRSY